MRKCFVDHPAPRLAFAHGGIEGVHIPAIAGLGHEIGQQFGMGGIIGEVGQFMWIRFKIKELRRIDLAMHELVLAFPDADQRRIRAFCRIFHQDGPSAVLALHERRQIFAVGPWQDFGNVDTAKRCECRVDVKR